MVFNYTFFVRALEIRFKTTFSQVFGTFEYF